MNYLSASLMIAVSAGIIAVAGLPNMSVESRCSGAEKGSIVAVINCPQTPELRVAETRDEPAGVRLNVGLSAAGMVRSINDGK